MVNKENITLDKTSLSRYCKECKKYTVFRLLNSNGNGMCEVCHEVRRIPPEYVLCDLSDPGEREFFIRLANVCTR